MNKSLLLLFIVMVGNSSLYSQTLEVDFVKNSGLFDLSFPYNNDNKLSRVFTEDTIIAARILEMYVDGKQIFPQLDIASRDYIIQTKTRRVRRNETKFYITTTWSPFTTDNIKRIVWSDLRSSKSYIIYEYPSKLSPCFSNEDRD